MIKVKGKKINPGKSNKMIWAVAGGIFLLFALLSFLLFYQKKPADARAQITRTLDYLKRTEGIFEIKVETAPNRVVIVYDSNFQKDFEKIAHFAAIRLAAKTDMCTVELAKNSAARVVYRIDTQAGSIVNEERIAR